ncbi:hypothetical protein BU24DRAFT_240245 [Aaosphaeria arxii CBS 175.79]|uniref:Uncharacterized protein n=1 Tax=Aaosphaeria arxii CBS 175.79 TaxID=1450172 RepID=A0A6A5XLD8_9PLEO|nr:uncharacterized protein BU24DRAFT_240245 [Aaosphaeria arxii CBS 175.79]KAF2013560.1 hypothetical protein BU24DRAFT_240245 [Aaosphaeria arxii CBS 175.79]
MDNLIMVGFSYDRSIEFSKKEGGGECRIYVIFQLKGSPALSPLDSSGKWMNISTGRGGVVSRTSTMHRSIDSSQVITINVTMKNKTSTSVSLYLNCGICTQMCHRRCALIFIFIFILFGRCHVFLWRGCRG